MPWLALGAGATGIASGIGSYLAQSSANDRAAAMQTDAMQKWLALNVPDPEKQKVVLEKFVNQGQLDPALQTAIQQDPSAFNNIVDNQNYKAAQNRALDELSQVGYQGGLRLQDKAALQDSMLEGQAQERANRQGIAAQMARRGISGSGFDVAAQLAGQQSVADRNAQNSLKIASGAQDRALQAIQQSGALAGQLSNQDYQQQAQKAASQNQINQFNTANLRDVNAGNVQAKNAAQVYNLNNAQRIADSNTQIGNQQNLYNSGLQQQQYDNQLRKLSGETGQTNNLAQTTQQGGQITANAISNIGSGVAGGIGAQANYNLLDDYLNKKK